MMIAHQTIDWTERTRDFERVDQIGLAGNGNLYHVVARGGRSHVKSETCGAMAHEIEKAARPKSAEKYQCGRLNHCRLSGKSLIYQNRYGATAQL